MQDAAHVPVDHVLVLEGGVQEGLPIKSLRATNCTFSNFKMRACEAVAKAEHERKAKAKPYQVFNIKQSEVEIQLPGPGANRRRAAFSMFNKTSGGSANCSKKDKTVVTCGSSGTEAEGQGESTTTASHVQSKMR